MNDKGHYQSQMEGAQGGDPCCPCELGGSRASLGVLRVMDFCFLEVKKGCIMVNLGAG